MADNQDKKIEAILVTLKSLDKKIDNLDRKVDNIDRKIDTLDKKIDNLEIGNKTSHQGFLGIIDGLEVRINSKLNKILTTQSNYGKKLTGKVCPAINKIEEHNGMPITNFNE